LYANAQSSFRVVSDGNNVLIKFQKDVCFPNKAKLKEIPRKLQPGDSVLVDMTTPGFRTNLNSTTNILKPSLPPRTPIFSGLAALIAACPPTK